MTKRMILPTFRFSRFPVPGRPVPGHTTGREAEKTGRNLTIPLLLLSLAFLFQTASSAWAQGIAYVYPAGAGRGTTTEINIVAGGANGATDVLVSGKGVSCKIIARENSSGFRFQDPYSGKCSGVMGAIMDEESRIIAFREDEKKLEEARKALRVNRKKRKDATKIAKDDIPTPDDEEVFRTFMYFHRLAKPSIEDLQLLTYEYRKNNEDRKYHSPDGSVCAVEVTVDPDAEPGEREIQFVAPGGISRPAKFWISDSREVTEIEPNEGPIWEDFKQKFKTYAELPPQKLPVVYNGQIKPGDLDQFWFFGEKGQRVVFEIQSRSTKPYIANAVPGWFNAFLTLYGPDGREIKSCDSWRFDQNPMMFVKLPESGRYMFEIRDYIWRGRNDFVYRVRVGELPIIYSQFPLGGPAGEQASIRVYGGNLSSRTLNVDCPKDVCWEQLCSADFLDNMYFARPFHWFAETLPIVQEPASAQRPESPEGESAGEDSPGSKEESNISEPVAVTCPTVIYGRIDRPREVDIYQFEGKKDQPVVLSTSAQVLGSNLDTVVELRDAGGNIIGTNDDPANHTGPNLGTEVHHSDAHLEAVLPADGTYFAWVYGCSRRCGPEYFYRLRISAPQPNFTLLTVPSSISFRVQDGKPQASFRILVFRREGFKGPITLSCKEPGEHFQFNKGTIGPEEESVDVTLTCTGTMPDKAFDLILQGTADVGEGKQYTNIIQGADDWEQAFIWHHWVTWSHLRGVRL